MGWALCRGLVTLFVTLSLVVAAIATGTGDRRADAVADEPRAAPPIWYPAPGISPPGANDFTCRPSSHRPNPVVLVHGTFSDMTFHWRSISPALVRQGYCVFALDYGNRATGPIQDSARQLAAFVDRVLQATGASKVAIVGHSQGGIVPRQYLKAHAGAAKVDELVSLAAPNRGTRILPTPPLGYLGQCKACRQLTTGSLFLRGLNAGGETLPGVSYTMLQTKQDLLVVPYTSAFLHGPAHQVTNVLLQDACPRHLAGHSQLAYDPVTLHWIQHALARPGPAAPSFRPRCVL